QATKAADYEQFYRQGTSDEAIWGIERDFLAGLIRRQKSRWGNCSYLDFACGTGRVISFVEALVSSSLGIDTSEEMLRVAAKKVQRSELLCIDITERVDLEGTYDLITAFRFFLNAEPP